MPGERARLVFQILASACAGLALIAGAWLVFHGRGGGPDAEQRAYRRAANAACKRDLTLLYEMRRYQPETASEAARGIFDAAPLIDHLDRALHRLRPSEVDTDAHGRLLDAISAERRIVRRAAYDVSFEETGQAFTDVGPIDAANKDFLAAARGLHLARCATPPPALATSPERVRIKARMRRAALANVRAGHMGPAPALAPDRSQTRPVSRLPGAYLYLVPMDGVSLARVKQIGSDIETYLRPYGYRWRIEPRVHVEQRYYSRARKQIAADRVSDELAARFRFRRDAKSALVVGVTDGDLYWSTTADRFVLGVWTPDQDGDDGWAVISTARLDPRNYGELPDDELLQLRLRKMVARYVGRFMYRIEFTSERPHSLFRPTIASVEVLDGMTDHYCDRNLYPVLGRAC